MHLKKNTAPTGPAPWPPTAIDTMQLEHYHRHRANMFAVECKDYCLFGMLVKNFDTGSNQTRSALDPNAAVRFCVADGRVFVTDLLLASYSTKHRKSATVKIQKFLEDDRDTVLALGLQSSNDLDLMVFRDHPRFFVRVLRTQAFTDICIAQKTNFHIAALKDGFKILDRFFAYKRLICKTAASGEAAGSEAIAVAIEIVETGKRKKPETLVVPFDASHQNISYGVNCFAVACRDSSMSGKLMKHIDFTGILSTYESNDEYIVRFRNDGMVLLGDLLVRMKKHLSFDSAQKAIKNFMDTDHHIVRGLEVTTDNTLTKLVRVA